MVADGYKDCPKCNGQKTVRIDGVWDFALESNGKILYYTTGKCFKCGQNYS